MPSSSWSLSYYHYYYLPPHSHFSPEQYHDNPLQRFYIGNHYESLLFLHIYLFYTHQNHAYNLGDPVCMVHIPRLYESTRRASLLLLLLLLLLLPEIPQSNNSLVMKSPLTRQGNSLIPLTGCMNGKSLAYWACRSLVAEQI